MSKSRKLQTKDICRYILNPSRSNRACARALNISPTTVAKYRNLLKLHRIDPEALSSKSNIEVEDLVQARYKGGAQIFAEPDWPALCVELGKPGVTIALLYYEYVESHRADRNADLLSASSFGRRLRAARKMKNPSMRQTHPPGARSFVDFSGKHLFLTERGTGKRTPQEVFVASLGTSQLIFATAVPSQKLSDWIEANVRALEYFGGVPLEIVPDNLKSAVTKPSGKGRPAVVNRSYLDFAEHYHVAIHPARIRRPQDKALAEIGVRMINMWVIAALRNHVFYTLADMNREIMRLVNRINERNFRKIKTSRRAEFERIEAAALQPLPSERYEYVQWRDGYLVPKDYHLNWENDHYSVPHHYIGRRVNLAATSSAVRIYADDNVNPIALHKRGQGRGENITERDHMPPHHRAYAEINLEELCQWAAKAGEEVALLFDAMQHNKRIKPDPLLRQMVRAQKIAREYGEDRFLSACRYANSVGTQTIESVANILRYDIDLRRTNARDRIVSSPVPHDNVRGGTSYDGSAS
ncbi:IS21 family transposase [Ruegeria arenilitoris]|uniref:IS21 family transposase n=1 Tax=Ruegeria arenilitoris TaxID=1173585 RepID=UPI00147B0DC7|nr:IS21 family transposase [Ruegeria arenilitoris]